MKKVHHYELSDELSDRMISAPSLVSLRIKVFKSEWRNYSLNPFSYPLWYGYTVYAVMRDGTRIPIRIARIHPRTRCVTFCRLR